MTIDLRDRFRGCLLGLACGDALGAQVEFMRRGSFPWQVNMTGKGPHKLKPGQWTDDTAMALHLAEHLLVDPSIGEHRKLVQRWIDWMVKGEGSCTGKCFDIGSQTRYALNWWSLNNEHLPENSRNQRAWGNGSLMRVAPVALRWIEDVGEAAAVATFQSTLTHPAEECCSLSTRFVELLIDAMRSEVDGFLDDVVLEYRAITTRPYDTVLATGRARDTFEASLWCIVNSMSGEDAIVQAVNLGDDADTTGAVTGALVGALYGASTLPERWLKKVAQRDRITKLADNLFEQAVE